MRLTVPDFARAHSLTTATASKILRRAELDGLIEVTHDAHYKPTYYGAAYLFSDLVQAYLARIADSTAKRLAGLAKARQQSKQPPPTVRSAPIITGGRWPAVTPRGPDKWRP